MGDLLCMNGSDHLMPQPQLGRVVAEANDLQDDLRFEVTSLADYLSGRTTDGLTVVEGELRSGFPNSTLRGIRGLWANARVERAKRRRTRRTGVRRKRRIRLPPNA